jgi:sorbitol-specific phosphotransferase system component IIC
MTTKTKNIASTVLMAIPALMVAMSAIMKLTGSQKIVDGLTKGGLGNYISLLGILELISVALFVIPKTYKLGFLLLCCYLGGAMSVELASGQPPMAAIFLALIWISVFLRNRLMFLNTVVE